MEQRSYKSFAEFWPYYVSEHRMPGTRRLHFFGTLVGLLLLLTVLVVGPLWLLLLALVCGYFFAWVGHFFIEKNRPATFKYPLYSFAGDLKMFTLMLRGKMDNEIKRHAGETGFQSGKFT